MSVGLLRQPKPRATLIAFLTLIAVLAVRAHAPIPLRAPAGVLLVLVLAGAPWLLLNGRQRRALETPALVIAASLGITMIVGFAIDLLPKGLTATSWAIGLAVPTLLRCVVPWLGSVRPSALSERFLVANVAPGEFPEGERALPPGTWTAPRLLFLVTGTVALTAILAALAWVSLTSNTYSYTREHFTVLSLNSTAPARLTVGVVDHEEATVSYLLTAVSEGHTVFQHRVTLRQGAEASILVRLPATTVLLDARLKIELHRIGHPGIYRSLALTPHEGRWQ